jgi:hypothetical protein
MQVLHPPQKSELNHFKMVEAMGLKLSHLGPLQWHRQPTNFLKIQSSKVVRWGTQTHRQTHTQTDRLTDLIRILSFLKESRLKIILLKKKGHANFLSYVCLAKS